MASWNISTSTPLPTSNRCAHARPKMSAKVVVVTQHIRVIFQVRLSCPPACRLDTPTTIELKISGTNSILSKPIKILLTMPMPYKLISKNEVCGNIVSRNPNNTPNTARSEEHTSELQSRENLVCRLLLVKKNNAKKR